MCFEFGCFGGGRREDIGGERPTRREPHGRGRSGNRRNGAHYSNPDRKAPPTAYHNQPHSAAADEAGQKGNHDGGWKDHHTAVITDAGGDRGYAAYVQDKAADYDIPKLPAWDNQIGDDADYTYTPHLHEPPAGPRENAGLNYGHYPTTTTTTLIR